jgi:3-phosphoshikimate 1-carboxyvinyltransferase
MLELTVPGDKSITHRALMLAALAEGHSRIEGALAGDDCRSTASVLRALGCVVPDLASVDRIELAGVGLRGLRDPQTALDCGNSGTTVRLLMGVIAGAQRSATFDGDASLRVRPMRRVTEPLMKMGAHIQELGAPGCLPIRVTGAALRPFQYELPQPSAQVKSALLLAGLLAGVPVSVRETLPTRDHTERMLRAAGVPVMAERVADGALRITLQPCARLAPLDLRVPGDFSSATFLMAAALLGVFPSLRVLGVGINPTRTGLLDVLPAMGAHITQENVREQGGEPVADLTVQHANLRGTRVPAELIPRMIDEVPMLALLAARAAGETEIRGASELRVKESDRIRALVDNLRTIGVPVEEHEDGMVIQGTQRPLRGVVHTHRDHRIAMAFGVLAAQRGNDITLDDTDVVAVSYPEFFRALRQGTAR